MFTLRQHSPRAEEPFVRCVRTRFTVAALHQAEQDPWFLLGAEARMNYGLGVGCGVRAETRFGSSGAKAAQAAQAAQKAVGGVHLLGSGGP